MRAISPRQPHPVSDEDVTVRRGSLDGQSSAASTAPAPAPAVRPATPPYLDETAPAPEGLAQGQAPGRVWSGPRTPPVAPNPVTHPAPPPSQYPAPHAPLNDAGPRPPQDLSAQPGMPSQQPHQWGEQGWAAPPPLQHRPADQSGVPGAPSIEAPTDRSTDPGGPGGPGDTEGKPTTLDRIASAVNWLRGREKASEARRQAKEAGRSPKQRTLSLVRELTIIVVIGVAVTLLLRAFVLQPFGIPSESMEETLMVDDKVVVSKLSSYDRGEVLVFRDDHGWLDPAERTAVEQTMIDLHLMPDEQYLTKRLIGMPGDRVQFDPNVGKLTVNGYQLDETDYLFADSAGQPVATVKFEVVVPEGHVFMMGDNRSNSRDSRCYLTQADESGIPGSMAFIPTDSIVGPAAAIYLPVGRAQTFQTPRTFAAVPSPTQVAPREPVVVGSEAC